MAGTLPSVTIVALEGPAATLTTGFNPVEIGVDKSVPWQLAPTSFGEQPALQFPGAQGRTLSIQLVLGEPGGSTSVQPDLDRLQRMASIMSETGPEDQRRPPRIALRWAASRIPEFVGVVEALAIRYEAIRADGTPLKASVTLRVREASRASVVKKAAKVVARGARRR